MKWFVVFLLFSSLAQANRLKPFNSDGCTAFLEGTPKNPNLWAHCCLEHDLRYWFGGSLENQSYSDLQLRACVRTVAGKKWANVIYRGVRAGHHSPIRSKYQWSWGWTEKRGFKSLEQEEKYIIIQEVKKLPFEGSFLDEFLNKYLD